MSRVCSLFGAVCVVLMIVTAPGSVARANETFGYTSAKPQLWETSPPVAEREPGTNLYWHDPILGNTEMCRFWPAEANGCAPRWYARADMLALYRDAAKGQTFATIGPQGLDALSTSSFRNEFEAGTRVVLGRSFGSWYRLEGSYFGAYQWNDRAALWNLDPNALGGTGNLFSPFSNFGDPAAIPGVDYNDFVSIEGQSKLSNGELNLRRRILMRPGRYEASFLLGGRYMDIDERFAYYAETTTPGPGISTTQLLNHAHNKLIGFQIGLLSQFLVQPRCWIDFDMKGGIFQNRVTYDRLYTLVPAGGPVAAIAGNDQIDRTSFVGDLSLQFNYQFAHSWTFYAGYNAIWVTGIALAAENAVTSDMNLLFGPTRVNHSGQALYHGVDFGLVFSY